MLKRPNPWMMVGAAAIVMFVNPRAFGSRSTVPTWDLTFKGVASGGTLILARTRNKTVKYVSIQTAVGESAESVAQRLAATINLNTLMDTEELRYDQHILWKGRFAVTANGNTLTLPLSPRDFVLAGTETGLGIPQAPLSLSCSYLEEADQVVLHWLNPPGRYDFILVNCHWTDSDHQVTRRLPGTATSLTIQRAQIPLNIDDMDFRVIGYRENIPSNAAAMHASGHCQEELYGIPFSNGVAPNWASWSTSEKVDRTLFEQGEKYPNMRGYNPALSLLTIPFHQVIKAPAQGVKHGVYRKFLGLTPGHTYRLTSCSNTGEMDSIGTDWAYSVHAIANRSHGQDLSFGQLAGMAVLPDGKSGQQAGLLRSYGPGRTTEGEFKLAFTGDSAGGRSHSSHITLPSDADSITVWVRLLSSQSRGEVAFSGVRLEDITANPSVAPPDEIRKRAHKAQEQILRRLASD